MERSDSLMRGNVCVWSTLWIKRGREGKINTYLYADIGVYEMATTGVVEEIEHGGEKRFVDAWQRVRLEHVVDQKRKRRKD